VRYEAGKLIDDRFEVLGTLGQGGMSETYHARDRQTGGEVVVKIPFASLIGDPAMYSRYEREMQIGRQLSHPNIQRLVAEGRIGGRGAPYMVFEYIDGQVARLYLNDHLPLSVDEAVRIAAELAGALAYCHELGIVHRDLKPENVLMTRDGHPKLADFGIALLRGARRLTFRRVSNEFGTPDYMAPEQVRGERGDARTDVYAVGVMLYEMIAGEVPYQGDNALAVMSQRVTTDAPLLRRARPGVPPGVEAIVYRALRREPAERYQTMAELQQDLKHPEAVVPPEYDREQLFPPLPVASVGPLPSMMKTIAIVVAVFVVLILIGVIAEMVHHGGARLVP